MSSPSPVCHLDDLPLGRGREFIVEDRVVALFRTEAGVFAVDGICPHAGGPLAQGMVRRGVVTCPWHGWQYNVQTGHHQLNPRLCVQTFAVTVIEDAIYVNVQQPGTESPPAG